MSTDESLGEAFDSFLLKCNEAAEMLKQLEFDNNRLFIEAYGLQDELSPEVSEDQITLYRPDVKRTSSVY